MVFLYFLGRLLWMKSIFRFSYSKNYGVLNISALLLNKVSATVNSTNFAQNCPNLLKSIERQNFEIPPKI